MAENNVYTQLYERMFEEQERFREWLLAQPPSEILNHCYEYADISTSVSFLSSPDALTASTGSRNVVSGLMVASNLQRV